MHCSEFLRLYSDYRDGLLSDARLVRRLSRHLAACRSCTRYDGSLRAGVQALRRTAVELEPTPQFRERLRERIAAGAEPAVPVTPGAAGVAALLMLAAALALVILQTTNRPAEPGKPQLASTEPPQAENPTPMVVVNPSMPFVTFTDLATPTFGSTSTYYSSSQAPIDTWASLPR